MPRALLADTDVMVDYLRGHPSAVRFVKDHADRIVLSAMSVAELYAGVRGAAHEAEQVALSNLLGLCPIVPVSVAIARAGGIFRRDYGRSHGIGLADAVIAATAVPSDAALKTPSVKHHPMFKALEAAYRR